MKNTLYILFIFLFISCESDLNNYTACDFPQQLSCCGGAELSVLSFNRLESTSLNSTLRLIQDLSPDVVGLQESYGVGLDIATSLGYCYYGNNDSSLAFLSKFEMEFIDDNYVRIQLNDEQVINFFNIHFTSFPYQPYQIRDGELNTVWEIEHEAEETRREEFQDLLVDLHSLIKDEEIILVGDFNEPSHLDWNIEAANQGLNFGYEINWPISSNLESIGMIDSYRQEHPNPITNPGFTWTPFQSENEVHDRIDFVYYSGRLDLNEVSLVGPDYLSDIVIDYYESDHRAVFAKFTIQ